MPSHPALEHTTHRPWPLPSGPWVGRMTWTDLLFAHWPVPVSALRAHVPGPLAIQECEGSSWVGLVPFRMEGVSGRALPDVPGVSAFNEMNLRLYVTLDDRPGIWFMSLDANSRLAVLGARAVFHLPYFYASMEVRAEGERVLYRSQRIDDGPCVAFRGAYWPASAPYYSTPGTLEHFLTERYCLYAQAPDGTLRRTEIHHPQWPLQQADAVFDVNQVAGPQGIALPDTPPLLHFARRQDVVFWPPARA